MPTDGLEAPQANGAVECYPLGYQSHRGTLPFCAELPHNCLGLQFELSAIVNMSLEALMKLSELQRQQCPGGGWVGDAPPRGDGMF